MPGNVKDFVGKRFDQNYDVNKTLANGRGKETIKHSDGFDYKLNNKRVYQRWNKDKSEFEGGEGNDQYTLKKKNLFTGKESAVGEMAGMEARFHTAMWSAGSGARAARFEAENKGAEDEKKKIVHFDDDQLHSLLSSITSSKSEKRAAGEMLSERGKFKDFGEIEKARSVYGTNGKSLGDFNKKVNEKQADKAYDFDNTNAAVREKSVARFHSDIEKGNVDITKISRDALPKENIIRALEGFYGDDLPEQLKKIGARSLSKKDKDSVGQAYGTLAQMHVRDAGEARNRAGDLMSEGKEDEAKVFINQAAEHDVSARKVASQRASYTGQPDEAFKLIQNGDKFDIDINAAGEYLKKGKPKDFEEIEPANLEKLIKEYGKGDKGREAEARKLFALNMNMQALKKMASNGDKGQLVEYFAEMLDKNGRSEELEADKNLEMIVKKIRSGRERDGQAGTAAGTDREREDSYGANAETAR